MADPLVADQPSDVVQLQPQIVTDGKAAHHLADEPIDVVELRELRHDVPRGLELIGVFCCVNLLQNWEHENRFTSEHGGAK